MPDHVVAFPEKLLKTIATRCAIFSLKSTKNRLAEELGGRKWKGREGMGVKEKGMEGRGEEGEGEGRELEPLTHVWLQGCTQCVTYERLYLVSV